ncbi:MAG: HPP family protein, partial [Desulfobacteraceae bacterium]
MLVKDWMSKTVITVDMNDSMNEAAEVFMKNKISGAPVVDETGEVVGTITKADLFRVLIALTGVGRRGIQFAFQVEDSPGSIKEVADIIRRYGGRMVSILSTYERVPKGYRKVFIGMYGKKDAGLDEFDMGINLEYITKPEWAARIVAQAFKLKFGEEV